MFIENISQIEHMFVLARCTPVEGYKETCLGKPFTAEEIVVQKQRIMDEAANAMASEGISQLSMRALATSVNMTAANLYNYFPSKRQLFIETTQRGYELLDSYTKEGVASFEEPRDKLAGLLKSAVRFAHDWTGYWELMVHPPATAARRSGKWGQRPHGGPAPTHLKPNDRPVY
jgi:hypothetical protein